MASHGGGGETHSRRTVLAGVGGVGLASLTGVPLASADPAEVAALEVDPFTRDTYRAIVDAIVPETPQLDAELGEEHVPGGLDVSLESFVIYGLNNFHEIQVSALQGGSTDAERLGLDLADENFDAAGSDDGGVFGSDDGLFDGDDDLLQGGLFEDSLVDDVFGALGGLGLDIVGENPQTGAIEIAFTVETDAGTVTRRTENYPYAELFALVFELVAIEFLLRRENEDDPERGDHEFPSGGLFTRLSREDRLRCLESIIDGGLVDALESLIGKLLPTIGVVKFAVMAIHGLTTIGHYSEWAGYGDTRTDPFNDRELRVPEGEVLGHRQADFPGFEPGYADHRGFEVQSFRENEWEDAFEDDDDGWDWDWGWF